MSLKALHIVFVVSCILIAVTVAWIFFARFSAEGGGGNLAFGIGSALGAVALVYYGKVILKKLENISYL
jgi:DNA-binding transcriptional regulator of glucitol operon